MKFKATIVVCLITALLIGATTAVMLIQEAKQQTQIALEILEESKRQTKSALNTEEETKKQTQSILSIEEETKKLSEIEQKSAELLFIQIRTDTNKRAEEMIKSGESTTNVSRFNDFGNTIVETSRIGKALNQNLWESLNNHQ